MILGNSIYVSKSTETSGCRWLVALDELVISLAEGLLNFVCWLYVQVMVSYVCHSVLDINQKYMAVSVFQKN